MNVSDNEAEDVIERAYDFVTDCIATNRKRFSKDATPCLGRIEADKVLVIATELRRALEENEFSYIKCHKGFSDRGYTDSFNEVNGAKRSQYLRSIQGVKIRVFIFPMKAEKLYPPEEDFMK
ncbi:MAG: hypothetical protein IKN43_13155 [Selenomonadaceae bacterium]|nr:hypothetical protein [Selenomonadaceae bacterium]